MRITRTAAPVVLGLATLIGVAAMPALTSGTSSADAARTAVVSHGPTAQAAGVDVVTPVYPSIVNVRLERAEDGLGRAAAAIDQGQEAAAIPAIIAARDNMVKAWSAAKYVISQTPATDPEAEVEEEPVGAYAAPADTAAAVLSLQHDIVTTGLGLLDVAGPQLAATIRGTISGTMTVRDAAINYLHTITPPVAEEGSVRAEASDAPVGGTVDVVMPLFVPQLADEIQQANGSVLSASSPANFGAWVALRAGGTQNLINTYWPPIVED